MNPKKVWSIILIVLGVLFILGGINNYHDASLFGKEIESMDKMVKKYGGKVATELYNADQYRGLAQREKFKSVLLILLGIAGAISGTWMLKNSEPIRVVVSYADEFETESIEKEKWRF